jgi:hypothetical protein
VRATVATSCRRVVLIRRLGRALVGPQVRPAAPATPSSPICAHRSSSLALSRPSSSSSHATACHCRRHSELLSFVAPTSFFESTATNDLASPPHTLCARSIVEVSVVATLAAHQSMLQLW